MMKKLTTTLFFTLLFFASNAQQINSKIQEVYGEKTQEILQNDPERIKVLTDLLNNRIKIVEVPVIGDDKYPKLSEAPLLNKYNSNLTRDIVFDPNNFNPLKYGLNFFSTRTEVYRIDNTNYIISILPQTTVK